jgi:opacity protein-like surface antigen
LGLAKDRFLVYADAGWAYGRVELSTVANFTGAIGPTNDNPLPTPYGITQSASLSDRKHGTAYGAGAAYAWSNDVSLFAEWMRIDLGTQRLGLGIDPLKLSKSGADLASGAVVSDVKVRFDVIQAGVNVKFCDHLFAGGAC